MDMTTRQSRFFHGAVYLILAMFVGVAGGCGGGGGGGDPVSGVSPGPNSGLGTPLLIAQPGLPVTSLLRVAVSANGDAIVAWDQRDSLNSRRAWVRRYASGGLSAPETIDNVVAVAQHAFFPAVAMNSTGSAIVLWNEIDNTSGSGITAVWSRRYVPGVGWEGAQSLGSTVGFTLDHDIAVGANGDAIAVWRQWNAARGVDEIYASRLAAGQTNWAPATLVDDANATDNAYSAATPHVALDDQGGALVVWNEYDSTGSATPAPDQLYVRRFTPSGGWGNSALLRTMPSGMSLFYGSSVAMVASDHAVLSWSEGDGANINNAFRATYVAGAVQVEGLGTGFANAVAADGGRAVLTASTPDSGAMTLRARAYLYTPAGGWSNPVTLDAAGAESTEVLVAMNDSGQAVTVWQQWMDNDSSTNVRAPYASFFDGSVWMSARKLNTGGSTVSRPLSVGIDASGNAFTAWWDVLNGDAWINRFKF